MIGVIADDLTGAAELGGIAVRQGLRADIVSVPAGDAAADVVVFDTDSRGCSPDEAGRRARTAARFLQSQGAGWIYKKTDSVLRGPITAELSAVMRALRLQRAVLVPANPSRGRVIRCGRYYINGIPLDETDFRNDPEHPRDSAAVLDLLEPTSGLPTSVVALTGVLPPTGVAVGGVETRADVAAWATTLTDDTLPAGGADFFEALLARRGVAGKPAPPGDGRPALAGPQLFVCGSTSESCRSFVSDATRRGVPAFSLAEFVAGAAGIAERDLEASVQKVVSALAAHPQVILHVGLPLVRAGRQAENYAHRLVQVMAAVLNRTSVNLVCAEGGATAAALVRRMAWSPLHVLAELAPGVALLGVKDAGSTRLVVKPGSYPWPAALIALPEEPGSKLREAK